MADAIPEPVLTPEERALFEKGVAEFNAGCFFECHDSLEDLWSGLRGPGRDFFQGLIQTAVAFHHLSNRNLAGAESMLGRALKRLEKYPARYFGLDLDAERAVLAGWLERLRTGGAEGLRNGEAPRWRFDRPSFHG